MNYQTHKNNINKTVALVDVSMQGHHLAFMRLFAKALLDLNYKVVIIAPDSDKVIDWLSITEGASHSYEYQVSYWNYKGFGRFNHAINTFLLWKNTARYIRKAEKHFKIKVDFVFFAWLDSFLANYLLPQIVDHIFPYPWSGLYFHPRHMRMNTQVSKISLSDIDIVLSSCLCKNIAIHDDKIISSFEHRIKKPVIFFPEIADDTSPDSSHAIVIKIKSGAKDRVIIGMIGLEKRKGTITMIRLARKASRKHYYFVFAGMLNYKSYSSAEVDEIKQFIKEYPENCFFHLEHINEGYDFNSVFCCFDIPFVLYENFASTSNLITKAAIFGKYVLATERYIIGEDVNDYNLGITVEEGNIEQSLEAIELLRQRIIDKVALPESYQIYKEKHNAKHLLLAFKSIISNN